MEISMKGINLIHKWEGLSLASYYDPAGVLTIGYGHTNNSESASMYPVYEGQVITAGEADDILIADMNSAMNAVNTYVMVELTQNQYDALVSFTYNLGAGTLAGSDLLAKLNQGDVFGAAEEFSRYVHAGNKVLQGLVNRRKDEQALFVTGLTGTPSYNVEGIGTNNMIQWMKDRVGKVTYSMDYRYGPNSYDCSSAVYFSLMGGGFLPEGHYIGNTETLFNDLEGNGWVQVPAYNGTISAQRGDIFIWGIRGQTAGASGHTGIFIDSENIIHCNYADNGISISNHDERFAAAQEVSNTIYRFSNSYKPIPTYTGSAEPTGNTGLIPYSGIFYPTQELPVSGDTDPSSAALGYYEVGDSVIYDSYIFVNGYAWISYIAYSGARRYLAVGPDDGRTDTVWGTGFLTNVSGTSNADSGNLIPASGVFYPTQELPISADVDPNSASLGNYEVGQSVIYDSYVYANGYVWISYIAYSGSRHYIAIGPDDGRTDTVWGTGFFDNTSQNVAQNSNNNGALIPMYGVFYPTQELPVSGDTNPTSAALDYYQAGQSITYDSYITINGYVWISYISSTGLRRYIAIGPDDGQTDTTWGTGFFN